MFRKNLPGQVQVSRFEMTLASAGLEGFGDSKRNFIPEARTVCPCPFSMIRGVHHFPCKHLIE